MRPNIGWPARHAQKAKQPRAIMIDRLHALDLPVPCDRSRRNGNGLITLETKNVEIIASRPRV
jgi:hypothetical protein